MGLALKVGLGALIMALSTGIADAKEATSGPQPEALGFSSERLERLDAAMKAEVDQGRYPGVSVLVLRHGKIVFDRRYGFQSIEKHTPLAADTIFRIASMTKPIAGIALMILFEEGKWQLDDPISKFVPEFADLKVKTAAGLVAPDHPPTMRELVTSTAGFPGGFPLNSSFPDLDETYAKAGLHEGTLNAMAGKLAKLPLESQPGAKFRYGIQHDIQGLVVERISGMTFDRFLQERLFAPLGMVDTGFHIPDSKRDRLATLYGYDKAMKLAATPFQGSMPASDVINPAFFSGAGGLYSTAKDYERLLRMLANGGELDGKRILAPSSVRLMMSDMLPEGVKLRFAQQVEGVGYGVDLGIVLDPARASFNGGTIGKGSVFWTGAHGTWFWIDPQNDVIVLGMTQLAFSAALHMGMPYPADDLRAISRSLVYQALVDEKR